MYLSKGWIKIVYWGSSSSLKDHHELNDYHVHSGCANCTLGCC